MPEHHEPLSLKGDRSEIIDAAVSARDESTSAGRVNQAIDVAALKQLCKDMIETLLVERNRPMVHPTLREFAVIWKRQFNIYTGE